MLVTSSSLISFPEKSYLFLYQSTSCSPPAIWSWKSNVADMRQNLAEVMAVTDTKFMFSWQRSWAEQLSVVVRLHICVWEIPPSNSSREICCPEVLPYFSSARRGKCCDGVSIWLLLFPPTLPFTRCDLWTLLMTSYPRTHVNQNKTTSGQSNTTHILDDFKREWQCTYNNEARSRNHCCSGKAISIKYSVCVCVCVFVALVTQHAMRMRRIIFSSVACPDLLYFSLLSHKSHDYRERKKILNIKCGFWFSLKLYLKHFLS